MCTLSYYYTTTEIIKKHILKNEKYICKSRREGLQKLFSSSFCEEEKGHSSSRYTKYV